MKEIQLTQGQIAFVDDGDFEWLNQWNWFAVKAPRTYYACRQIRIHPGKQLMVSMHRLIAATLPNEKIDHKNHIGTDNQRYNLRVCSGLKNTQFYQKPLTNTSGFLGVSKLGEKWRAEFAIAGKNVYLGLFKTPEEAAKVRDAAVLAHRGEFAVLNFV